MNAFVGIGTNLGDREANIDEALTRIEESLGEILVTSSVYESEPWGFESKDKFLNMVVYIRTDLTPSGLLGRILMIEAQMGRIREDKEYKSRIIDLDILIYEDEILNEPSLEIPHPRIHERKFVLVPLCEIAPDIVHPVKRKTFRELLEECRDECEVVKFK
jgi:2-amino-4-hydroxy-6-hydroxymethyldihydropteridine diphosphokinase